MFLELKKKIIPNFHFDRNAGERSAFFVRLFGLLFSGARQLLSKHARFHGIGKVDKHRITVQKKPTNEKKNEQ